MSAAPSGSLPPLTDEERAIFANAVRQARMLQRTLGPLCEVAIHDFRDLDHSLVHLEGSLTGRKLGAPITNIVVKAWRQQGDAVADLVGYPSSTPGGKSLKSSTSFLRRADGRVIGAFCMNVDLSDLLHFQAVLHPLLHVDPLERDVSETFATPMAMLQTISAPMTANSSAMLRSCRLRSGRYSTSARHTMASASALRSIRRKLPSSPSPHRIMPRQTGRMTNRYRLRKQSSSVHAR